MKKKKGQSGGPKRSPKSADKKKTTDISELSIGQVLRQAKLLDREGPQLLHAHRQRLSSDVLWEIADACRALRSAVRTPRGEREILTLHQHAEHVDGLLQKHLSMFRKSAGRQSTEAIIFALAIALFIRTFVFEPYRIPSGSMIPTLRVGDFIFVSKFVYGIKVPFTDVEFFDWRDPARGEIVIFDHPLPGPSYGETLIKRVMAVSGDRVRMENNVWHVNDEPVVTRVVARGLDENGKLQNSCLPSPGEECEWYHAELTFDEEGGTVHAEGAPQPGCPCTVLEESANGYRWNTQHLQPGVVCACSPPGKTLFGDCSLSSVLGDDGPREKNQVHVNWPNWPDRRDMIQYAPWKGWTWDKPGTAATFAQAAAAGESLEVPPGHIMVLGDNRDHSSDGRIWGLVPLSHVKGKAGFTWIVTEEISDRIFRSVH